MKKTFQSIGYKLLSTLVIATTFPMLVYCFFFSYDMRKSAENSYIEQTQHTWQIVSSNIEHSLSTSIDVANKGIYLNGTLQDLLFSRDGNAFSYAESANSSLLFSYMTNIYSMTPEATQIQFSTYKAGKSFLLTTKNLQKYLRNNSLEKNSPSPVPAFQAYIMPPHRQTSYGHQLNHISLSQEEEYADTPGTGELVFTVCLPIYHLPSPMTPIGQLRIDISMEFFQKVCNFLYDQSEQFFIVDSDYHVIFASDPSAIGTMTSEPWIQSLIGQAADDDDLFVSKTSGDALRICQKLPGDSYHWYMLKSIPKHTIYQSSNNQLATLLLTFSICLLITILINGYSILHYTNPLKKATTFLNHINTHTQNLNSRLSEYVTYKSEDEIGILFRSLEEMMDTINNFVIRQYELEIINRTTELKMLEAQINPHFINEELSHIDRYIKLQKMRFTNHLSVFFEVEETVRKIIVPKMILQPLIENSFKHGNLFKREKGTILVQAHLKEDRLLHVYIVDNGCTPSPEKLAKINKLLIKLKQEYTHKLLTPNRLSSIDGSREKPACQDADLSIKNAAENLYATNNIGLTNVLLRLLLNFGQECSMELYANELGGTTVHLIISHKTLWNQKPTDT